MESHGRAVQDGGSLAGHQLCAPSRLLTLLGLRVMLSKTGLGLDWESSGTSDPSSSFSLWEFCTKSDSWS